MCVVTPDREGGGSVGGRLCVRGVTLCVVLGVLRPLGQGLVLVLVRVLVMAMA